MQTHFMNPVHGRAISAILTRVAALLLLCSTTTLHADAPERIFPFMFFENGMSVEVIDFDYVPPGSFTQRFLIIKNGSEHKLNNVTLRLTGPYSISRCMAALKPGDACQTILNYHAPEHASWNGKWLDIEFTVQLPNGTIQSDSQRIPVIGGVQLPTDSND